MAETRTITIPHMIEELFRQMQDLKTAGFY